MYIIPIIFYIFYRKFLINSFPFLSFLFYICACLYVSLCSVCEPVCLCFYVSLSVCVAPDLECLSSLV